MTKKFSDVTASDLTDLLDKLQRLGNFESAEEAAQAFVGTLYHYFQGSAVLLRLFTIVPYSELAESDRHFVDRKTIEAGTAPLITEATPIFSLLGTRGRKPEWNDRETSQHFRCIPLASTAFVSSLSMLSRQFRSVGFDLDFIDNWEAAVSAVGRADQYSGMLYIRDAGADRDEQGRMIVPKQEFVAANNVRTVVGLGSGYADHPTLVTLFAFTDEIIERAVIEPRRRFWTPILRSLRNLSGRDVFSSPPPEPGSVGRSREGSWIFSQNNREGSCTAHRLKTTET